MENKEELGKNRFQVRLKNDDELRPFRSAFAKAFNNLPQKSRSFIYEKLDPLDKGNMDSIKEHLKTHFQNDLSPNGQMSDTKKWALLKKYRYSRAKVEQRKKLTLCLAQKRNFNTPTGQRSRIRSKCNTRLTLKPKTLAPTRAFRPENLQVDNHILEEPPDKCLSLIHI